MLDDDEVVFSCYVPVSSCYVPNSVHKHKRLPLKPFLKIAVEGYISGRNADGEKRGKVKYTYSNGDGEEGL